MGDYIGTIIGQDTRSLDYSSCNLVFFSMHPLLTHLRTVTQTAESLESGVPTPLRGRYSAPWPIFCNQRVGFRVGFERVESEDWSSSFLRMRV